MKRKLILCLLAIAPALTWAGDNDDFGTWLELGAQKALPHNLTIGLEGELRTENNSSQIDRLSAGVALGYKVNKYFKLGASYNLMGSYNAEKRKEHYKDDIEDDAHWNGYKIVDSYWTPKHRLNLEATATIKLWKWLRISARERYQYTHARSVDYNETKYRFTKIIDSTTGQTEYQLRDGYPVTETNGKVASDAQYIRSRIKLEVDKKRLAWSPFVSVEFHNSIDRSFHLHKLRTSVGTEYAISSDHKVGLAYVLSNEFDESPNERMHAISASYKFDF